jgi:phosphoglycerate-specific signal transduction histidine kinase
MTVEQVSNIPLRELSAFAESFSVSLLEELLAMSSMAQEEMSAFRKQYGDMQSTLDDFQKTYRLYEERERPALIAILEEYLRLLKQGPEAAVELIQQLPVVVEQARKIDALDNELMEMLKDIWPEVQWPEQLRAFEDGEAPDESVWPKCRLKEIFEEKNRHAQEFLNNSWVLVQLDIAMATEELKKEKIRLESIATALGYCCQVVGLLAKVSCVI